MTPNPLPLAKNFACERAKRRAAARTRRTTQHGLAQPSRPTAALSCRSWSTVRLCCAHLRPHFQLPARAYGGWWGWGCGRDQPVIFLVVFDLARAGRSDVSSLWCFCGVEERKTRFCGFTTVVVRSLGAALALSPRARACGLGRARARWIAGARRAICARARGRAM